MSQFGNNFNNGGFGGFSGSFDSNAGLGGFDSGFQNNIPLQNYDFGSAHTSVDAARGAISMELRKVYLGKTRPQADQQRRSYDVVLDGSGMQAIQQEVEKKGTEAFNPSNLGSLMQQGANFIRHSGAPEDSVSITNGWEIERFRFTLVVDVFRNGRFMKTEFISGSTDYAGIANMGMISSVAIDPQMVFTINHVTEATVRQMDATGRPVPLVNRSNGVVRNNSYQGLGSLNPNLYMTRPSDILRAVDKVDIYRGMNATDAGFGLQATYQDLDSMLTAMPMCSADTNLLLPTFTSRTLRGLYENSLNEFDPMNMDGQGPGAMASHRVQDTAFSQSSFVHLMNRHLANHVTTTAQFTYADLLALDPTVDDRADVFGRSYETGTIAIPDGRTVNNLGEANTISLHATSIAHTTLALMSISGVATLAYSANNVMTGQSEVTLQACDGIDTDGMLFQRLEVLKTRLIIECLNIVGQDRGDYVGYEVDVFADAFNDVFIQLRWDNNYAEYVVPAFASSSLAPVVTNSLNNLTGMAEAIHQVVDACKTILAPSHNNDIHDISVQGNGNGRFAGLAGDY